MNAATIIIIVLLAFLVILAGIATIRSFKRDSGCSSCPLHDTCRKKNK